MPVRLKHTIVYCGDQQASDSLLSRSWGSRSRRVSGFTVLQVDNDVSRAFLEEGPAHPQHYAFLAMMTSSIRSTAASSTAGSAIGPTPHGAVHIC